MTTRFTLPVVWPLSLQTISESPAEVASEMLQHFVPVITPPGATQFEEAPDSAKLFSVPLLPFPLASVRVVTALLLLPANPWLKLYAASKPGLAEAISQLRLAATSAAVNELPHKRSSSILPAK